MAQSEQKLSKFEETLAAIDKMEKNFQTIKDAYTENIQTLAKQFGVNALAQTDVTFDNSNKSVFIEQSDHEDDDDELCNDTKITETNNILINSQNKIGAKIQYKYKNKANDSSEWYCGNGVILDVFSNNNNNDNDGNQYIIKIKLEYGTMIFDLNKFEMNLVNIAIKLPEMFFVYGTLRDDDNSKALYTTDWIKDCIAENAKLYGFKLYKYKCYNYPFAIKTNNNNDYIVGRLLHWNNTNIFKEKLKIADQIEGYQQENNENNLYEREIVQVVTNNNNKMKAIVYYQINKYIDNAIEITDGDWLKRDLVKQ